MKSVIESYTARVNDLQRVHNISPRKGAAASGEVWEQLIDDVVRQYPNLLSLKNDFLTSECNGHIIDDVQVDRHIRKNNEIKAVIESKCYLDAPFCGRAVTDFMKIAESPEVNDNVDFVIICGQLTIAKKKYDFLQAFCKKYVGKNFKVFALNENKKRNSKRPLYKEKFPLDLQELGKFNDYIASL